MTVTDETGDATQKVDIVIIGGGIAGLWTLNILRDTGYDAILIDHAALGAGQTLASQGMIHGGMKYNLAGLTSSASETIKGMPARWRACLAGEGTLNLQGTKVLSDVYHMFTDGKLSNQVTAFFGAMAIEGNITSLAKTEFPAVFTNPAFKGSVYQLNDLVLDAASLIQRLAERQRGQIVTGVSNPKIDRAGERFSVRTDTHTLDAGFCILTAGSGNEDLANSLELPVAMQRRPLHQVVVKGDLPSLYAHAVSLSSADKPKLTITTHTTAKGNTVWYLGGALAEDGVELDTQTQIQKAQKMLRSLFPWLSFDECVFSTLRIDRAEPAQTEKSRPDTPFVKRFGNVMVCWPIKLTLTPMMGDMILKMIDAPTSASSRNTRMNRSFDFDISPSPWDQPR